MLGPIVRLLTVAISAIVALASPVAWYWQILIFLTTIAMLDRLITDYAAPPA